MMEGMGKERALCTTRPFQWQNHTEDEAQPWLWKLSDCFSSFEQNPLPFTEKPKDYMENRKPVLELKDVPPPPHHTSSKSFPTAPLPNPPSCFQSQQQVPQQMQQQGGANPKVSVCACYEGSLRNQHSGRDAGFVSSSFGGVSGGGVSLHISKPLDPLNASSSDTITCQVGSALRPPLPSLRDVCSQIRGVGCEIQHPTVAASQSIGTHPHLPCCAGLLRQLHPFPTVHSGFGQTKLITAGSSVAAPSHDGFLTSSRYYPCREEFLDGARAEQHFSRRDLATSAHLYTNPLHLNVEHAHCLKGTHYCGECLRKSVRAPVVDTAKVWPNIPPPPTQSVPIPIPMCNGCGIPGTATDGLLHLGTSLGKSTQKYGSPDSENSPPVGVFWDIENCSVPSGRSAVAVVQRIREQFFQGHREAEFICVCDISKENKEVIQELNNCQVTVAHINATAKNAADDKLRQSLRRFADTHASPATVVLVSSDVNFACELSDLRHRHGFQVILVHKNQASDALLQHAHRHVTFEELVSDLPPRVPGKTQEMCLMESKPKLNYTLDKQSRNETPSPQSNGETTCITSVATKSVGIGESPYIGRRRDSSTPRSVTDSPVEKAEKTSSDFYVSTPSAFSKLNLQRTMSPLILSQGSWSSRSRSGSPCLSNRSSPLTAPTQNPSPCPEATQGPFTNGVDIQVANLDYRMSRKDLQQILHDTFSKHGRVKSVELSPHTDYQLRATVQFGTLQEAIRAVSGLHRYKIGGKRIQVSLVTGNNSRTLALLRSEIITILQDAPACCLPLFKFTEIYEKKFGHKLGVSDLNKLTDTVAVRDQGNSRLVCLLHSSQARQSPLGSSQSHDGSSATCSPVVFEELEYHEPICKQHSTNYDFSESEFDPDSYKIPFVFLSMKTFASQVHGLLQTHEGTVPLLSFPECYASEFSPLKLVEEGEGGVPLEHLITCIPGINIVTAQNGIKVVKWIHNKPPPPNAADPWIQRCKSPVGNPQLIQFSREVVDLMKNQPCCIIPISNFIPTYHHHFAKQCRVSDYGYSKLLELLEAVPHVLQILGMGSKRLLTLTHRAHVKRFTQDLLKLLKSQASKEVVIRDFMQAYHWCFSKDWDVTEYGVCELTDLLAEIPDTTVCVTQEDGDMVISIPKRERTQEEVERTKQFAKEVVDLIRHQPHFRMPFNKFIPSYHHHFGRQCKLTYYGFSKLMELFEAIPEVLLVLECGEEKILALTEVEKVKALAAQFVKLLRSQTDNRILMSDLLAEYGKTFGYGMRLQDFDVSSVPALLQKLCHVVKMVDSPAGREIQLINRKSLRSLTTQLLVLLMSLENPSSHLCIDQLLTQYEAIHGTLLNPCEYGFVSLSELLKSLPYLVEVFVSEEDDVQKECVRLTRLYQFARSVRALLHTYHYQQIFLSEFPSAFSKYTGKGLQHRAYGYSTVEELLGAIPQVVWIKGHGHKKIIVLKNDMKVRSSPSCCPTDSDSVPDGSNLQDPAESTRSTPSPGSSRTDPELLCLSGGSPVDLLCGPVPSCLPSPQLHPDLVLLEHADLIQFEERPSNSVVIQDTLTSDTITPASGTRGVSLTSHVQKPSSPIISQVNKPPPPCTLKGAVTESSAKKTSRNKVKLAANFSFAPVTRL
ncbi:meiosis regulator and mRNA stability factor 1-like isoform X4 [Acipenser ruthenus]|uniref:meiosis regulator and mRNA stability factor 1-like isoform X4 n=1 Tax=Acipenser ruthenus TaxID=7906 RepID=UPI002740C2A9|nr:meiosis regulator and mRNA stability factor 1-like isoform X4 [Acipenser ruthenus]